MQLPVITQKGIDIIGLNNPDNLPEPMLVNILEGGQAEAYTFSIFNRRGKPVADYLVLQIGVVFYCGKNYHKRSVQQHYIRKLFKDGMVEWKDIDINCPFPEIEPQKLW